LVSASTDNVVASSGTLSSLTTWPTAAHAETRPCHAPEKLAGFVQQERRDAEHASLFSLRSDRTAPAGAFAGCDQLVEGATLRARLNEESSYRSRVFYIELATPESLAERIVIATEYGIASSRGQKHPYVRGNGVVDFARTTDDQIAASAKTPGVHVGIANLAPIAAGQPSGRLL
jgi:hypothetical protein